MIAYEDMDWERLGKRLQYYAVRLLEYRTGYSRKECTILWQLAEDFVMISIQKFLEGKRRWNAEKCDIETFLKGVISSDMYHYLAKEENNISMHSDINEDFFRNTIAANSNIEEEVLMKRRIGNILDFLKENDKDAYKLARLIVNEGIFSNMELSSRLRMSRHKVSVVKMRLRRWVNTLDGDLDESA